MVHRKTRGYNILQVEAFEHLPLLLLVHLLLLL
jgi:hypothetical protein